MNRLTVNASDLLPGDVLIPTMRTVKGVFRAGVRIPSGKVEVILDRDGRAERNHFRKDTRITVERP